MPESCETQQLRYLDTAEFLRRHGSRAPSLMWLLGAGASAAAGIPTAGQMIWDFKRSIFCSEERVSLHACENLEDPAVQGRIQRHFQPPDHPKTGDVEEYPHYFERAFPDDADRRRYVQDKVLGATPSFGHESLAALVKAERARIIWTTNFDRCIETSITRAFNDAGRLVVADLSNPTLAAEAIKEERWPVLGKLHGDFQSRRLKNTADELREQDGQLRQMLTDSCKRYGLVVVGYSGRDESVMLALSEAAVQGGFPQGLFWIHRGPEPPLEPVQRLIDNAVAAGIDAAIVEAETFDEILGDVLRQTPNLSSEAVLAVEQSAPRLTSAPVPSKGQSWPVIRTNALPITEFPSVCRRVQSEIGGAKELRAALEAAGASKELVVARTNAGVLAFGSDEALRRSLKSRGITQTDLHTIDTAKLSHNSGEHGLLIEALAGAIGRELPMLVRRSGRDWTVLVNPDRLADPALAPLKQVAKQLVGKLPSGTGRWAEAVTLHLDWKLDGLWLLIEPRLWLTPSRGLRPVEDMSFVRERRAQRYNKQSHDLLQAWVSVMLRGQESVRVSAFGGVDGIDAAFVIDQTTAFSRRALHVPSHGALAAPTKVAA
jgi:NAD-dependent SIR2 family protein deacetylase